MSPESEPSILLVTMDRASESVVFTRSDGREAHLPLTHSPFEATSTVARFAHTGAFDALLATTTAGDDVALELPARDGTDQRDGRLAVYLDQNKWRDVTNALTGIGRTTPAELEAARQLAHWVGERKIVLPVSAAHWAETTKWSDTDKRYQLGLTMLRLGRGWQMRDPLQVRRDELRAALARHGATHAEAPVDAVFTLAPDVIHGAARGWTPARVPADLPSEQRFQLVALRSTAALIDVMLDTERVPPGSVSGWVESHQRFSDWLDSEKRDARQKRRSVDVFFLNDIRMDIATEARAARLAPAAASAWVTEHATGDLAAAPALGLLREMFHERHLNKGTTWRTNDLTDMLYLSCAAGYADFVVCERAMGGALKQGVERLRRPVRIFPRLSDVVEAIEDALKP
ncbi:MULTISPECIES: hypothetical protein [unclassified Streptomyces]|uniref:hypothetical protein n=1 Tax=unclassified Streptomyces TaxID=2593676 RepID=UPI002E34658B|nr:hypothetical protein [Streptomyces sp. NBC_01268]